MELHNVLVGDVWLCGGQSNMQVSLRFANNGEEEVKAANHPEIRFFSVAPHAAYHHTDLVEGTWKVVSPETADRVSAVAYYFARKVQQEIHVPIGLVVDCLGGTPAEAWTSAEALRPLKDFDVPLAELEKLAAAGAPEYGNYVMHWYDEYDIGIKGNWAAPIFDDSTWKSVDIPGGFSELGVPETPAVAWFRREIVLPDPLPAGRALLFLGSIERMDTGIHQRNAGRRQRMGREPARLSCQRRLAEARTERGRDSSPENQAGRRIPWQTGGAAPDARGQNEHSALAGEWKGQLSVDARPPHAFADRL